MATWTMESFETRTQEPVTMFVAAPDGAPGIDHHRADIDLAESPVPVGVELEIVGRSRSGSDAVERVLDLVPDVLVVSTGIRDGNAREVCRDVREWAPATQILVVAPDDDELLYTTIAAGAASAILSSDPPEALSDGVFRLTRGESLLPARTARRLLNDVDDWSARSSDPLYPPPALTSTEREVLAHLAAGDDVERIAAEFDVTTHLVSVHTGYAVAKLHRFMDGAHDLAAAGG